MFSNETINIFEYVTICLAMVGVVIMTNPNLVFFWMDDIAKGYNINDYPNYNIGIFNALFTSLMGAFVALFSRKMG